MTSDYIKKEYNRFYWLKNRERILVKKKKQYKEGNANSLKARQLKRYHFNINDARDKSLALAKTLPYKFKHYIRGAKKRNLSFDLSFGAFVFLCTKPCYWCDISVSNGVDRINNKEGYTYTNSVSCCKTCNKAKNNSDPETFIEMCVRVANKFDSEVMSDATIDE
ncbi:MAG: hypothetical protein V3U54_11695 [Thermodesulfobacteriota bacterium]